MVAQRTAVEDAAGESHRAPQKERLASGAVLPAAAGELVDVVTGLPAEELHQVTPPGGNHVHAQVRRRLRRLEGRVLHREAHQDPRRVHAGLGREPDQASLTILAGRGRDDERRARERVRELGELGLLHSYMMPADRNLTGGLSWDRSTSVRVISSGPASRPWLVSIGFSGSSTESTTHACSPVSAPSTT